MLPSLSMIHVPDSRLHVSSDAITFNVMVRKGNGDFEILEKDEMVASGRIYAPVNAKKEKITITESTVDELMLDGTDFYRYVLIAGYNFKGAFRSIRQINSQGSIFYYSAVFCIRW